MICVTCLQVTSPMPKSPTAPSSTPPSKRCTKTANKVASPHKRTKNNSNFAYVINIIKPFYDSVTLCIFANILLVFSCFETA